MKEHKPNWSDIPDHPYIILIAGCSGSAKTNVWLNLINHKQDIDKICINKRESTCLKYLNDSKAFIEYSNGMDIYKNIEEYNPNKKMENIDCIWYDCYA